MYIHRFYWHEIHFVSNFELSFTFILNTKTKARMQAEVVRELVNAIELIQFVSSKFCGANP